MKPRILHLSADYPDRFQPAKTRAISGLVEGTSEQFDHLVVSLNRTGGIGGLIRPGHIVRRDLSGSVLALSYAAPPAAVAIGSAMARLADAVARELAELNFSPDLIQGHKLTVEGLAAKRLAERLKVPYVITVQGNTDQKLLSYRPDRLRHIRSVWDGAKSVMAFAPWAAEWCEKRLGQRHGPLSIIPCLIAHDARVAPSVSSPLIRTAFNLDFWRNKNVETLLAAVQLVAIDHPEVRLEIAGEGSTAAHAAIAKQIAARGQCDRVRLVGAIAPDRIQSWFNGAAVLALPSRRESFGMVFAESLLAGTPVIFSRGTAIDGFFPGADFARSVDPEDAKGIAAVLLDMITRNASIKFDLANKQAQHAFDIFSREQILADYTTFLETALL